MTIVWIIGLLLCLLDIYLLKGSRINDWHHKNEPVLRMWHVLVIIFVGLLPIFNLLTGISILIVWIWNCPVEDDWIYVRKPGKILTFLNKPVK